MPGVLPWVGEQACRGYYHGRVSSCAEEYCQLERCNSWLWRLVICRRTLQDDFSSANEKADMSPFGS